MTIKVLLAPVGKHGSYIVGVDGCLRVVDRPACHGFQNGCVCKECRRRAEKPKVAEAAPRQPWDVRRAA